LLGRKNRLPPIKVVENLPAGGLSRFGGAGHHEHTPEDFSDVLPKPYVNHAPIVGRAGDVPTQVIKYVIARRVISRERRVHRLNEAKVVGD